MYKQDLVLNNLQGLICHKTKPNQEYIAVQKLVYIFIDIYAISYLVTNVLQFYF